MMLVDKETGKGYVEMEKVHHDKKEYASKGVAGTAIYLKVLLLVMVKLELDFQELIKI